MEMIADTGRMALDDGAEPGAGCPQRHRLLAVDLIESLFGKAR
jgi:hypothetical protein